jgi:hypothetical protein
MCFWRWNLLTLTVHSVHHNWTVSNVSFRGAISYDRFHWEPWTVRNRNRGRKIERVRFYFKIFLFFIFRAIENYNKLPRHRYWLYETVSKHTVHSGRVAFRRRGSASPVHRHRSGCNGCRWMRVIYYRRARVFSSFANNICTRTRMVIFF